jgi:PhnB protein
MDARTEPDLRARAMIAPGEHPAMPPVTPHLTVRGAADAIAFYARAFGATEDIRMAAEDGERLLHACITINGGKVMLADEFPELDHCGAVAAPSMDRPAPVAVAISYAGGSEVDAIYARAVSAGCAGVMEPHDAFWGDRFAVLCDPFGHRWLLAGPLEPA